MSSLNLHLDFMDKNEPPVRFVELTAEEELQITQDSVRLMEQIDEDVRILDRMCSALENMILIQNHYDEYGSSPALEALVGDIKEYLGISMEAEEAAADTTNSDKKEGGGIAGGIKKVIDWICGIFRRIGEWLNIVEKKADTDAAAIAKADLAPDKKYKVMVMALCYKDGQVVNARDSVMSAISGLKKALEMSSKIKDVSNTSVYTDMYNSFKNLRASAKRDFVEVGSRQVKDLAKVTYDTFKGMKKEIPALTEASEHLKDSWDGSTYNPITKKKQTMKENEIPNEKGGEHHFVRMAQLGIATLKELSHSAAICLSACRKILHGDGTQSGSLYTDNEKKAKEQKKNTQETKPEEKK